MWRCGYFASGFCFAWAFAVAGNGGSIAGILLCCTIGLLNFIQAWELDYNSRGEK